MVMEESTYSPGRIVVVVQVERGHGVEERVSRSVPPSFTKIQATDERNHLTFVTWTLSIDDRNFLMVGVECSHNLQ